MTSGRPRRVALLVERARASLWLVPSVMVLGAICLSSGMLYVDRTLAVRLPATQWWLFGGNAEGARTLLSVIAGSLITVISVAFSVTMIAIQQASTQYTPRVLRNYTKDRGNQLVLGTYIATFAYALLVLREVRAGRADAAPFVPTWSILGAMLLALASLGALIYFMHHVSESLQVSHLLGVIRRETDAEIAKMFPETIGARAPEPERVAALLARDAEALGRDALEVRCEDEGYLRHVDEALLVEACRGLDVAVVPVKIGDRLQRHAVVLRGWGSPQDVRHAERIRSAFQLDRHRSTEQDVAFGIRQIVDIAVKALSPGINDPTTAEEAIAELVGALALLLEREMPSSVRRPDTGTLFHFAVPSFDEMVDESFSQIRRHARAHVHVTLALLRGLRELVARAPVNARRGPLRREAERIAEALPAAGYSASDAILVRRAVEGLLSAGDVRVASSGGRTDGDDLHPVH